MTCFGAIRTLHYAKEKAMKVTVEAFVRVDLDKVWAAWNNPADIVQWNAADETWHTKARAVDFREGGTFRSRMEAKNGTSGFDFEGTDTRIVATKLIQYQMSDGREVQACFVARSGGFLVTETFDAETENPPELQRHGWQAFLNSFSRHVEAKS
ncbi:MULTISPECIES: SRPBCC domain-containing protein [unclassified Candidatus Accumulibacter]|jgi:uncharacterized protein YndB with AHSA1/START domain|uniref:Activator of Hsp90 ATPase homologue 1/2-like C-terminal domain-containing protein n=1 Tax=Candidatus Accumulibacter phosphatis TaxID=327160 RepID=A0A080LY80_9PROT|nr:MULTISPECIES: SRPBCC domain-containing protein [unclassified Candidatus Accumulibacter]KFB73686.1 MAG: hypothetical protein AW09_001062 [Candidatus Accumulibacter phosphatis]HRE87288.1 SRPBCC domain-containing protein [Accumulibacter sp.]